MPKRPDGSGSVYYDDRRKRWVAAVSLPSRQRVAKRTMTQDEAVAALEMMKRRYMLGTLSLPTTTTLPEWYDQWRDSRVLRASSLQVYGLSIAKVVGTIGPVKLSELSGAWITACINTLRDKGMGSRNLQLGRMYLAACLTDAVQAGLIDETPMLRVPKVVHTPKEKTYWTLEETRRFLTQCEREEDWAQMFVVLATTGLRLAEAAGLTWGDVDLRYRALTVTRTKVRLNDGIHDGPPKTASGRRTLSLTTQAVRALGILRERRADARQSDLVFVSRLGTVLTPQTIRRALHRACRRADIPLMHPHGLRHVAGALAWAATHDVLAVQKRLGHSRPTVTMDVYAYLMSDDTKTSEALDHILDPEPTPPCGDTDETSSMPPLPSDSRSRRARRQDS